MNRKYSTEFEVKWADVDPNLHLRHTVYLDYGDQTRIRFFDDHNLSFNELMRSGVAPILFGTQTNFIREVLLSEKVSIDCELLEITEDGRKWSIKHLVYKGNGDVAAEMIYRGAWFDLKRRKVIAPPQRVRDIMLSINHYKHDKKEN
ncbi:MAG: acyl-CoA thioesterase [Bacteroidota bacterium]